MKKVKDIIYKSNNSIYDSNEPKLYTEEEVKTLIKDFYSIFCKGTGLEDLRDNWIKENLK